MQHHEFFRGPAWPSAEAQQQWQPLVALAAATWRNLETLTVGTLRPSALFFASAAELLVMVKYADAHALEVTPVALVEGRADNIRVALHRRGLRRRWLEAWGSRNDLAIGELLGFPACCRAFFDRVWNVEGKRDTTLSMLPGESRLGSILLRWLDVRLVGHLPCGHGCEETERQAAAHAELGRARGLGGGVDALERLLRLPITYSALHGAGIVETPVFRFMFSTDYTPTREAYTKAGVLPGLAPIYFGEGTPAMLHGLEGVVPASAVPGQATGEGAGPDSHVAFNRDKVEFRHQLPEPTSWADNGFGSAAYMAEAHAAIDDAVPLDAGTIVDLGCGDGALLERLRARRPGATCMGWEFDAGKVTRGRRRHPAVLLDVGRLEEHAPTGVDVALLMPGRLLEMSARESSAYRQQLALWLAADRRRALVCYAYSDHRPLAPLLERAGIVGEVVAEARVVEGPRVDVALLKL